MSDGLPIKECKSAEYRRVASHIDEFRRWMLLLLLLFPGQVLAAGLTCTGPAPPDTAPVANLDFPELEEVVVTPGQIASRTTELGAWLKRLEGQYTYEGYVDLCGNANAADRRQVTGSADCASLYERGTQHLLSLYCVVDVRWEKVQGENGVPVMGGESRLSPAVVVYGVVPDLPGIQLMQMDNKGIATHAQGKLAGDTLTATGSCGLREACRKVTRITPRRDSQDIAMRIDFEIDSRRVQRHAFLLHRVSNSQMNKIQNALVTLDDLPSVGER